MPKKLLQTLLTVGIAAGFFGMVITRVTPESAIWVGDTVGYSVGPITFTRPPHWACPDSDEKLIYFDGQQANVATEDQARTANPKQVWCNKEQTLLFAYLRKAYSLVSSTVLARSHSLSPVEVFQKVSPSIFVLEALDDNGKTSMLGSGVALARDFLITNCHVVQSGSSLRVSRGKANWTARLIQAEPNHDLCGLRPGGLTLQPVEVRPSSKLATGERVYAVGSPEGLELTFSEGVISALRETEGVRMIQTSAPISPGSSGGGLFDVQGNLVGITTFYLQEGQSLNFALPGEWTRGVLASSTEAPGKSSARLSDPELESRAWLAIGLEATKKEDYNLAVHSLSMCANLKQSDAARAWLELGHIDYPNGIQAFQWSRQEAEAKQIAAFEKAIEEKPDYAEAWLDLASVHGSRKEYNQAISAAKEATRLSPGDWIGWVLLGANYTATGSYDNAIDAFQRGEKVAPGEVKPGILSREGRAYAGKGDRDQVLRIYKELKSSNPETAQDFFKQYVLPTP